MIDSLDDVKKMLAEVDSLHEQKLMDDNTWAKCVVAVALEFFELGEENEAMIQLSRPPLSYFQEVQPRQMEEDESYAEIVVVLAYRLIQLGVLDSEDEAQSFLSGVTPIARA